MTTDLKPKLVSHIIIKAPQQRVWEAITKPEFTVRYYYGNTLKTDLTVGAPFTYYMPNGAPIVEGQVVSSDPPNRLIHTYHSLWAPMNEDAPTKVTWELEALPGGVTKVTVIHEDFQGETATYQGLQSGGKVRRFADDCSFLRGAFPDQVACDDHPSGYPDARLELHGFNIKVNDSVDQPQPGSHGLLGVVFVCLGVTEIDQDAIAHVAGNKAGELDNYCSHRPLIPGNNFA